MEPVITDGETPWNLKESDLSLLEDSYERLKTLFLECYNKKDQLISSILTLT